MARLSIPDQPTFAEFDVVTSTSAFPISFSLFAKADLTVMIDGMALAQSAFTFSGTLLEGGGYDGGTVTLNSAVDDVTVRIERNVAPARASQFAPSNSVPVGSIDMALNRLTATQQDLARSKLTTPTGALEGKFLAFDAEGNPIAASGTGEDGALRTDLAAVGGAMLAGTRDSESVQTKLDLLGAPPAVLSSRFYLTNALDAAEIADVALQSGTIDLSAKMNALVAEAEGREIYFPEGGLYRGSLAYVPSYLIDGQKYPGLKLFGRGGKLRPLANSFGVSLDTGVSFKFQDICMFKDFDIDCDGQTGAQGISFARTYRSHIENMTITAPRGDAIFVDVAANDADSSNRMEIERLDVIDPSGWAFNHMARAGANDLSYLRMTFCLFNSCGRNERKAITSITKASPAVAVITAHGFTNAQRIQFGGCFGMFQINTNATPIYAKVINANTIELYTNSALTAPFSTTSFGTHVTTPNGGYAYPAIASSGGVNATPQESSFHKVACTETKNVSFQFGTDGSQALQTVMDQCTAENTTGRSVNVVAASGLEMRSCDLRTSSTVSETHAHVVLDGSVRTVTAVKIVNPQIAAVNGPTPTTTDVPVTAFQGIGANLGVVEIDHPDWYAYDGTNQNRYGDGLFAATAPTVRDPQYGLLFEPGSGFSTTYTTASPTYTPDVRRSRKHIILLTAGASGTLTIAAPLTGGLAGSGPLQGAELEVLISNTSGGTINLTWGFATKSAPTTIANNATASGHWRYVNAVGWVQSAAWI